MSPLLLASAWVMGFLGSTHCVVMCGGVVAMSCSALPLAKRLSPRAQLPYTLAYNAGRIASYATAGAIAGALGAALASLGLVERAQLGLRFVAGTLMIAVGLYVTGVGGALRWIERIGEPMWKHVLPIARRLVPVRSPSGAFALGLLWGWLPCGLVYAALASAVTSGSAIGGAATMAAFGLGTLPTLLAMGSAAAFVARAARVRPVRMTAGIAIVAFGLVQVLHTGRAWARVREGSGAPVCCAGHARPG
jgi:sulfite exporter TauE/SafE